MFKFISIFIGYLFIGQSKVVVARSLFSDYDLFYVRGHKWKLDGSSLPMMNKELRPAGPGPGIMIVGRYH